jgi:hypothetical protein
MQPNILARYQCSSIASVGKKACSCSGPFAPPRYGKQSPGFRFLRYSFLITLTINTNAQKIDLRIEQDAVSFYEGKDTILNYQIAEKSDHGAYPRSNYIHPLYTLDGQILTEDFPPDHLHHRGIFWAWHQLYIGDKRLGDGWEIKDFRWEVKSVKEIEDPGDSKTIQAKVLWKSPQWTDSRGNEKAVVEETTTITVYPAKEGYRPIDLTISFRALEPNMRLGGSEDEKGYGGFSTRIRLTDDIRFTSSAGKVKPENLPVKGTGWIDLSGPLGRNGSMAGLSILCHPNNPGYPNPWILRSKDSMQNAVYPFPGATPIALSMKKPTTLRYRLLVHEGDSQNLDIAKIHAGYAQQ